MVEKIDEVVGDKIRRVFLQLSFRQPVHHSAKPLRRGEKKGDAGNRLHQTVNAFDHHSDSEEEMDLFCFQFHGLWPGNRRFK